MPPSHLQTITTTHIMNYFINLSNHPSNKWSDAQRDAAKKYGEIVDIPFPQIDPNATFDDVFKLANKYIDEIYNKYCEREDDKLVIHVMGELTFVYNFVTFADYYGITCVASTTERIVEEHDGVKTSIFKFIQFRKY